MFVRYEDLVSDPDSVQRKISDMTGISVSTLFSEARKISTSSVEKFRSNPEFAEYCRGIKEELKDDLLPFCDRFEYGCDIEEAA